MMSVEPQFVVRAELSIFGVPLLRGWEDLLQFKQDVDAELLPQVHSDGPGRTLSMPLDRITLRLSSARSVLSREYLDLTNLRAEIERLAHVAGVAIQCTRTEDKGRLRSYGYNIQIVFTQDGFSSGAEYLANHVLNRQAIHDDELKLVGGMATAIFTDESTRWTFRTEPWPNWELEADRVALSVNRHTAGPSGLPETPDIVDTLMKLWEEANKFMGNLNGLRVQ